MMGDTGNPSSAIRIAGSSTCASESVPNFSSSAAQPDNAPGTVIGSAPRDGMLVRLRCASASRVISEPERPLPFSPYSRAARADHTIANMSPPMLTMCGSTTVSTAAAATAASIALPPFCSTARPAALASG
jgi:hypothetical protein